MNKFLKNNIIFILVTEFILFNGCTKKTTLTPNNFLQWFKKNQQELISTKTIGDLTYSIRFLPTDYIILKELEAPYSNNKVDSLCKIKSGMQYMVFRIKINKFNENILGYKISSKEQYNQRLEYFSFLIKNDITLIDGKDTLRCLMSNFERYYGYAPYISFMLGFNASKNHDLSRKTFIFNDIVFNNGKVILAIDEKKLKKIPKLKL